MKHSDIEILEQEKAILVESVVGRNFVDEIGNGSEVPSVDKFLDYRSFVKNIGERISEYPLEWYEKELKAIDIILKIIGDEA